MFSQVSKRPLPNILISGTPGTGKTSLAELLVETLNNALNNADTHFRHIPVSQYAIENGFVEEDFDMERNTHVLDEDRLLDCLEDVELIDTRGGAVAEYHGSNLFPERWFDLVVVLRTEYNTIVKRLSQRGYAEKKVLENAECEVMRVCLDEAHASYKENVVWEMQSNNTDELDANVERISQFVGQYVEQRSQCNNQ